MHFSWMRSANFFSLNGWAGLRVLDVYGDFEGDFFAAESPDMIWLASELE